MRCLSCNCALNDFESTRKYESGEFVDLCNRCFNSADMRNVAIVEREDLAEYEDVSDDIPDIMEEL